MPYEKHYVFESPEENTKIWHYMDFTKFKSLLDRKALYFVTVEKLSEEDKFEGSLPLPDAALLQKARKIRGEQLQKILGPTFSTIFGSIESQEPLHKMLRKHMLVNCWHMNETESVAMWKLYAKTRGVAIQSTCGRLADSFGDYEDPVYIGKVNYIDFTKERMRAPHPFQNAFYPFVHKWKSFEYERELRACVFKFPFEGIGEYVQVKLDVLIDNIYVSPTAEDRFKEKVDSVVERYKLKKKLNKSALATDPLF